MGTLPWLFVVLAAASLVGGIFLLWESLRAALGATDVFEIRATAEADTRRRLLERKDALLKNLADLKFDRDAGKISEQDFEALDAKLRGQAKEVLRLLDEDAAPFRQRAEELITKRLAAADRAPYRSKPVDRPVVEDEETEPPAVVAPERPQCPSCETPNEPDAVFCKKCGARMQPVDGEPAEEGEGAS